MNNNARRPAGPVRQHSLQQPPPRRQQQIRRQRSTEDERNLQQFYSSNGRFSSNTRKSDHYHHHALDRPKVRVAWSDQPAKPNNDGVEIVARQIPAGKSTSRPTTARSRSGRSLLGEKATILYSRQELTERLRLAWRQREENKSNIDIFLAHTTVEERCDSEMSTGTRPATASFSPKVQKQKEEEEQVKVEEALSNEENEPEKEEPKCEEMPAPIEKLGRSKYQTWFSSFEVNESIDDTFEDQPTIHDIIDKENENKENEETAAEEEEDKKPVIEKKSSISINCNDWNASITINNHTETFGSDNKTIEPTLKEPDFSQAKQKRASYQSGLNKAFVGPIVEKPTFPRITSRSSSVQEPPTRFRRTSSAPPQRRTQVNIVIDTAGISTPSSAPEPEKRVMSATEKSRPIKSAPLVKRRPKLSKRRSMSKDGDCDENGRGKSKGSKTGKNGLESKGHIDVVTMVSLVSSADSESEMDENSPRDDKLICELRNKLPTTPIIKSTNGLSGGLRKPFKSVSFQQDSFDYDSPREEAPRTPASSLQARFVALSRAASVDQDGTATTVNAWRSSTCAEATLLPLQAKSSATLEVTLEAPLTDREKRCLAVPIGDVHDKKRKLVRCRSAVVTPRVSEAEKLPPPPSSSTTAEQSQTCLRAEMRMSQIAGQASLAAQENGNSKVITIPVMPTKEPTPEKEKIVPPEPYCQTPKEKECWHLYRRMCDKGVFVSFDTVLRGMLTPTEYRLRQKEIMSQNC